MPRSLIGAALALSLVALTNPAAGRADKPTKVEIAKRGKAATAFVDVPNRGTGTAFCVHPSGLFVTNEHVVRGAEGAEVTLVLNPALESQKVFKAKVVRADRDNDLALLRVEGAKDLPSLELGKVDGVSELADVVACGFPLGKALSTDKGEYPGISVNAGTVTALRQKGGELQFIQIDVALTYGNSGGPVLDDSGKLIGVVVSGIAGGKAGINQAIPVNKVERFLKAPEVSLNPPDLTPAALDKPQIFKARVVSFVPNAPEPTVKLVLQAGDEKPREFSMKRERDEWVATATPVVAASGPRPLELSAQFGPASITGHVDDVELTVGGKPVKLSAVQRIEFEPKVVVTLADGKAVEGPVGGLSAVEIRLGEQKAKFDFGKASQLTVRLPDSVASVTATVVVTADGKEVGRVATAVPVRGAAGGPGARGENLLVNGDFEEGPEVPGERLLTLDKGSTALKGWTVTQGTIDRVGTNGWQPAEGKYSVDLNGTSRGAISQTFKTAKGQQYRLTFSLAGDPTPDEKPLVRRFRVSAAGQSAEFEFDVTNTTHKEMGWVTKAWDFTATADETTLEFFSLSGRGCGAVIDNVSVQRRR